MTWTLEHDTLLCRDILVEEPYQFKMGTRERGHSWDLNKIGQPHFMVDQRAVRDHFLKLERSFKRKMAEEELASGISPTEPTELEQAIQDIIERGTEAHAVMLRVGGQLLKRRRKLLNLLESDPWKDWQRQERGRVRKEERKEKRLFGTRTQR